MFLMVRMEVWPVYLEPRTRFILTGGKKQDRVRTLCCVLLPDDGTCFTAAEVVKHALPEKVQYEHYRVHNQRLYTLANHHGLTEDPDNIDKDGVLLPGSRRGYRQRPRWNAKSWWAMVSDENWEWAIAFMFDLQAREASHYLLYHRKMRFFLDLETFEISEESAPPDRQPEVLHDFGTLWDKNDEEMVLLSRPRDGSMPFADFDVYQTQLAMLAQIRKKQYQVWRTARSRNKIGAVGSHTRSTLGRPGHWRRRMLAGLAAAVFLIISFWPWQEVPWKKLEPANSRASHVTLSFSEYVLVSQGQTDFFPTGEPISFDEAARNWSQMALKIRQTQAHFLPPPMFLTRHP